MRRIVIYTYYVDEGRLEQLTDMMLERTILNLETRNERELVVATNSQGIRGSRIIIAPKPGEVYYNRANSCYRVWFDTLNRDGAIEAIGNYILDRILPEIKLHKSFIDHLEDEKSKALKLLKSVSKD